MSRCRTVGVKVYLPGGGAGLGKEKELKMTWEHESDDGCVQVRRGLSQALVQQISDADISGVLDSFIRFLWVGRRRRVQAPQE